MSEVLGKSAQLPTGAPVAGPPRIGRMTPETAAMFSRYDLVYRCFHQLDMVKCPFCDAEPCGRHAADCTLSHAQSVMMDRPNEELASKETPNDIRQAINELELSGKIGARVGRVELCVSRLEMRSEDGCTHVFLDGEEVHNLTGFCLRWTPERQWHLEMETPINPMFDPRNEQ